MQLEASNQLIKTIVYIRQKTQRSTWLMYFFVSFV